MGRGGWTWGRGCFYGEIEEEESYPDEISTTVFKELGTLRRTRDPVSPVDSNPPVRGILTLSDGGGGVTTPTRSRVLVDTPVT